MILVKSGTMHSNADTGTIQRGYHSSSNKAYISLTEMQECPCCGTEVDEAMLESGFPRIHDIEGAPVISIYL